MEVATLPALALDNPQLARARELFRRVINEHGDLSSTSSMIADRVEQRICNSGPLARPITEAMIASQFGVGRRIVRQTSRILRQRGILMPRRGGNGLGGLWTLPPDIFGTVSCIHAELDLGSGAGRQALDEAAQWLLPSLDDRHDPLAEFVRLLLTASGTPQLQHGQVHRSHNLAEWLAGRLLDELALSHDGNAALGPMADIASDYGVSMEVAVEATRILSDAQKVEVRRGRAGGVYAANTGPGQGVARYQCLSFRQQRLHR